MKNELRDIHTQVVEQAPKEYSYQNFKNKIEHRLTQLFNSDKKIVNAYLDKIITPLFEEIQKNRNNNNIIDIDKNISENRNNNIVDISENFDEEFYKILSKKHKK